jgi:hypothetical protein
MHPWVRYTISAILILLTLGALIAWYQQTTAHISETLQNIPESEKQLIDIPKTLE